MLEGGIALISANLPTLNSLVSHNNRLYRKLKQLLPSNQQYKPDATQQSKQSKNPQAIALQSQVKIDDVDDSVETKHHPADIESASQSVKYDKSRPWEYSHTWYLSGVSKEG